MTTEIVLTNQEPPFTWIDVVGPSREELDELAQKFHLPSHLLVDCLEPEHLPKIEKVGEHFFFVIVRAYDEKSADDADSVQELTRKVAIFVGKDFLISVHRVEQPFTIKLKEAWRSRKIVCAMNPEDIFVEILREVVETYEQPLMEKRNLLEDLEVAIFKTPLRQQLFEVGYFLKRRSSVFRRVLRLTLDVVARLPASLGIQSAFVQDAKETGERLFFYAEEFNDNINNLINLQLALSSQRTNLASHKTNEVMRLLTVFSVFFMPLNLITGIYGMNFNHMPELKSVYGYPLTIGAMALVAGSIFIWFKSKGWVGHRDPDYK